MKARECEIQSAICGYLALRKHFFWRQNTAPVIQKAKGGWTFRRMAKYAKRGPYFLEVKRPGTYQSPEQKEFQKEADAGRALCRGALN